MRLPVFVTTVLVGFQPFAHADARLASLRAEDGTILSVAVYEPSQRPSPAVILVHMLTRSKADWEPAAERLQEAGFLTIAVDLRGHGESAGAFDASRDLAMSLQDVQAAIEFARTRPGVIPGRIGIAGASLGASLAAMAAAADPAVQAIALLSPSLDYRGLRCETSLRKYGSRAALLVAATNDPYSLRSVKQLATSGTHREVLTLEGAGHGTVMLSRQPELISHLVDWFRRTLL
jgi:alpha-beta hydrolase superfamily lysophospholipase